MLIFGIIVFVASFLFLFTVLLLYPGDRGRQNIAGFTFVGILIFDLFIIKAAHRIKTNETQQVKTKQFTLPYKVKKDKTYMIVFVGLGILLFLMPIGAGLSHGRHLSTPLVIDWNNGQASVALPMWALALVVTCLSIAPFYFLATCQRLIVYEDHLCFRQLVGKKNIVYSKIEKIETNYVPWRNWSHIYLLSIDGKTKNVPQLNIILTTVPKDDLVIVLNVIHQSAPDATFNDLAEQMRQGIFPKNVI